MDKIADLDKLIDYVALFNQYLERPLKHCGDNKMHSLCPFHKEKEPSFWMRPDTSMWKCEGCGRSGNATSFLAEIKHIDSKEAYRELLAIAGIDTEAQEKKPKVCLPHTLEEYSLTKALQMDTLARLGMTDAADKDGMAYVAIPYYDVDGSVIAVKHRNNPHNSIRFSWDKGARPTLYGLWLEINKKAKYVILVEGESDAQSLWAHGFPAFGVPGASNFQGAWVSYLAGKPVVLHIEPDPGGATFRQKTCRALCEAKFEGKVREFSVHDAATDCKDPSDLHVKHSADFVDMMHAMLKGAKVVDLLEAGNMIHQATDIQPPKHEVRKLEVYRASELYGQRIEKPPTIVQGMIPAGLTILAGAPKRGKSWLALLLGICVASGQPFLGMQTSAGYVLYLDLESRRYRVQERLDKLMAGPAPEKLEICHVADRLDGDLVEQLRMWCADRENPALIIIDTLGRVKPGSKRGENAYEGDTRILGGLQGFALEKKIAIVVVHHLRKSAGETDDFEKVSGSMGITGAADSVMLIKGKRGDKESTLSVVSRDFEPIDLVIALNGGRWSLLSSDSENYKENVAYDESPVVRSIIKLANRAHSWDGSPSDLLDALMEIEPLPADVSTRTIATIIDRFAVRIKTRDNVSISRYRTGSRGRRISIRKGDQPPTLVDIADAASTATVPDGFTEVNEEDVNDVF